MNMYDCALFRACHVGNEDPLGSFTRSGKRQLLFQTDKRRQF